MKSASTRNRILSVLVVAVLLGIVTSAQPDPSPRSMLKNIIIMGWDGCMRRDLAYLLDGGQLPALKSLVGKRYERLFDLENTGATFTKPGWAELLTGYTAYRTRVVTNENFAVIPAGWTLPERLEMHFGPSNLYTAWISSKPNHVNCESGAPFYNIKLAHSHGEIEYLKYDERLTVAETAYYMLDALDEAIQYPGFFMFVHFREPDDIGHKHGEGSWEYLNEIKNCDAALDTLVDYLEDHGIYNDTLIYVVTDHGFDPGSDQHFNAPGCWLATNDWTFHRRGNLRDLPFTIYHRLYIDTSNYEPIFRATDLTLPEEQWSGR